MEVGAVFIIERYPQYTAIVISPAQQTALSSSGCTTISCTP